MKKIIALLLAIMLLVSATACGGVTTATQGTTSSGTSSSTSSSTTSTTTTTTTSTSTSSTTSSTKPSIDYEGHVDANGDKECDDCGISVVTTFDFYNINDLHGKFVDTSNTEGVDGLSSYLIQSAMGDDNPIFLSSGDMWQGGASSNLTKGELVTDWMNEMGFAAMTLGNHEFDWGEEFVETNAALAEFPFLAINIYDKTTNQLVDYCQSSVLVECNGLQVGIIGAIGDCYSSISSDKVTGIYFKTGDDLTALVKAESEKLRAEGADIIIYSLHDGGQDYQMSGGKVSDATLSAYYDISLSDGYVDLVFEGHTHDAYVAKDSKNIYHLQNAGDNGGIAHAEIEYNFATGELEVTEAEHVSYLIYRSYETAALFEQLLAKYAEIIEKAEEVLGQNDAYMSGDALRQLVAQLYFEVGQERWGDQYNIVLGGGYLSVRDPGYLHAGEIIYADLVSLLPFDNPIVLCSVKGKELKSKFLETTNGNYFIFCGEYGESIKNQIVDTATYYVIVDSYTSQYAPNKLTEVARLDETTFARDLVAAYIKEGNMTTGPVELTSISEVLSIGAALKNNGTTTESYCVQGTIQSIYNTTYGNMIISDEQGNELTVYGLYQMNGTRYDAMTNPPKVGDVIKVQGVVKKYVAYGSTTIEIINGVWVED